MSDTRPNPPNADVPTSVSADRKALYDELLQLLCKSELAARNGEWMTCGTWAKNVMNRAYEIGNAEVQPQELDLPNIPDNEPEKVQQEVLL